MLWGQNSYALGELSEEKMKTKFVAYTNVLLWQDNTHGRGGNANIFMD